MHLLYLNRIILSVSPFWILLPAPIADFLHRIDLVRWSRYVESQILSEFGNPEDTGAAYIVLNPEYAKPTHRGARTLVFIGLGLSAIVPVTHCVLADGYSKVLSDLGFGWLLLSGALYISGALL